MFTVDCRKMLQMLFCVGNFFGNDDTEWQQVISGTIKGEQYSLMFVAQKNALTSISNCELMSVVHCVLTCFFSHSFMIYDSKVVIVKSVVCYCSTNCNICAWTKQDRTCEVFHKCRRL